MILKTTNPHTLFLGLVVWSIFCFLLTQTFIISEKTNLNAQNPNYSNQQQKRILQTSFFGFDVSRFSQSAFGGSQNLATQSIAVKSNSNQQFSPIFSQPVRISSTPAQSQVSKNEPLKFQKISNTMFPRITLYHQIPNKFLLNQVYTFKGMVTLPASQVSVIMSLVMDGSVRISATHKLEGKSQFQIPLNMSYAGKFYLTIFTGQSGQASRTQYEIIQRPQFKNYVIEPPKPIDELIIFERDNKIFVKWVNKDKSIFPVVKLTFEQHSTMSKVQLVFSNFVNQVLLPLANFAGFDKSTVSLAAAQAKSATSSITSRVSQFSIPKMIFFEAQQHCFSQNRTDLARFDQFPYIISPQKLNLTITGRSLSKLKNQMVVLDPSYNFQTYLINGMVGEKGQIPANTQITFNFDISQPGVYVIEINHKDGYAVLNRPVYVGRNIIPLIPDSQDLKDKTRSPVIIASQQPSLINQQRTLLINLINAKRNSLGLESVYLDEKLNQIAQQHTEDMVRRNYLAHFSPEGLGPSDRAANNQIFEEVGQNIAMNPDITDAHVRLARSNIHLRNIVNPRWVRVGLGVRPYRNNNFIVTQVFSSKDLTKQPLSQRQLNKIKSDILSFILSSARGVRNENLDLSSRISTWHETKPGATSSELTGLIRSFRSSRISGVVIRAPYSSQSVNAIRNTGFLIPSTNMYTEVGMSVKFNNGNLQLYIGYVA